MADIKTKWAIKITKLTKDIKINSNIITTKIQIIKTMEINIDS